MVEAPWPYQGANDDAVLFVDALCLHSAAGSRPTQGPIGMISEGVGTEHAPGGLENPGLSYSWTHVGRDWDDEEWAMEPQVQDFPRAQF